MAEVADELNVAELTELSAVEGALVDVSLKVDFRAVGRRMGKQVQAVASAVAAADPVALTAAYRAGTATVEVDGAPVPLEDGDLIVTETPREGWTVASGSGLTVALDLTLTPELERAGLVREVVRLIQEARKNSGLEVSDRIELWWTGDGGLAEALAEHAEQWAGEVLATSGARRDARRGPWDRGPGGLALLAGPREPLIGAGPLACLRARSRSARVRSGAQTAHGVKPSVRASSSGIGIVCRPASQTQPSTWYRGCSSTTSTSSFRSTTISRSVTSTSSTSGSGRSSGGTSGAAATGSGSSGSGSSAADGSGVVVAAGFVLIRRRTTISRTAASTHAATHPQ